ncbi:hypothetical protein E3N88_13470 [Mikania micrantha]|uniref:Protein-tyrosine-phosphatase n=1 Tax=Mikania micrantha TaxID=192012 RepID=A0A5N6P8H0_9ASTR|nr:hypothetical protein E3N88_13470 [Mikania micrantha]
MLGKEDGSTSDGGNVGGNDGDGGNRKMYWRSASWSSSRPSLPPLNPVNEKDLDPNGRNSNNCNKRLFPPLLTPRSNSKNRSLLPPLSIVRRSLDEWPKAGSDDVGEWPLPSTPSGERFKLDLSTIQRIPDKNATLGKREKIAFFDKKCSKVADHIFLGGDAVARDKRILKQHGITHILNCVGFTCPEYYKENFVYRTLWLQDSPSEDITSILYDVFDYFEDVREQKGTVFVHCCQGVSRSTSLVIAYRMWREGQSFDDAFQYVKKARGIADPNMGFACQLLQCQKRVHAFPLSPSSLLRLYRIAPHSPYDPLHLVPKMLNSSSPTGLDSRVTPGKRMIDSYNVDFEIFQKAIVGGFVPPFASFETEQETHLPARESSWSVLRRKFAYGNMKEFVLASKLSNISLVSNKLSPNSISNSSDFMDVNFTSIPSKSSLSIVECRGGTPRCLNMPGVDNDYQANERGNLESNDCLNDSNKELKNINIMMENELEHENVSQQVVAQEWPSLVKLSSVNFGNLDSRQLLIFTATSGSGNLGKYDLYLWVGKDFRHFDNSKNTSGANYGCGDPPEFDKKEVINEVLTCMGLPEHTRVKVVKQDKESAEFLALMSSL